MLFLNACYVLFALVLGFSPTSIALTTFAPDDIKTATPLLVPRGNNPSSIVPQIRHDRRSVARALDPAQLKLRGVDTWLSLIQQAFVAQTYPDVFYTGYPISITITGQWADEYFSQEENGGCGSYAIWDSLLGESSNLVNTIPNNLQSNIQNALRDSKFNYRNLVAGWYRDAAMKNIAQAYAEASHGRVYVAMADESNPSSNINGWSTQSAWGGWELPALTRNPNVRSIYRVDPRTNNPPRVIWRRGMAPTTQEPKGIRQDIYVSAAVMYDRTNSGWLKFETLMARVGW